MAVLTMKQISVFGLNTQRKQILEALHRHGVMEVIPLSEEEEGLAKKSTVQSISQFESCMATAQKALEILEEYAPESKGLFSSRRPIALSYYSTSIKEQEAGLAKANQIIQLAEKMRENRESIGKITAKQLALQPYVELDVPMRVRKTKSCRIKMGSTAGFWDRERMLALLKEHHVDNLWFEILKASKEQTYLWMIYETPGSEALESFFQTLDLHEPAFSLSHHVPREKIRVLEDAKQELSKEIEECEKKIKEYKGERARLELLYDHMKLRMEKYVALSKAGLTRHAFVLQGYIPEKRSGRIKSLLEEKYGAFVVLEEAEDPPALLENNGFAAPVEGITETYSMPSAVDIDPNPVMAFFYYLFFGMMFSDAGYGLLVMIVCGILGFGKKLEREKRGMFRMFFFCGVSTTFWGFMYGSFFGNAITTVASTFFGREAVLRPIWIDPVSEPLTLLIFSVFLGLIQILVGLGIRFYMLWRQKKYTDALFDVGFWMVVLLSAALAAGGMGLEIPVLLSVGKWGAIGGAAGLILTQGRRNKNIVAKLFGGIVSLYDITSYVSDVLSYSRLMALGLATGVIANVVNILGSLSGNSVIGVIAFIVISIVGHGMNFAINMLGAYVHTNRLQYVEFFSKFYEGGGRKFKPFAMNTKYYRFSDE